MLTSLFRWLALAPFVFLLSSGDVVAATGTLATTSPCSLPGPIASNRCTVDFNVSTVGAPISCVWALNPVQLHGCQGLATWAGTYEWVTTTSKTLELRSHSNWPTSDPRWATNVAAVYADGQFLGQKTVVAIPQNTAPMISLAASPSSGLVAPAVTTLTAIATDAEGPVSRVEFYNGASLLGTDTSSPFAFAWSNIAVGSYSVTAKAFDSAGLSATSSAINLAVASGSSNTPHLLSGRTIGADNFTIELTGTNFASGAYVDVRTSTSSNPPTAFSGAQLTRSNCGVNQCISLRISDVSLRSFLTSTGLYFWVVNPSAGWDGPAHVIGQAPLTYDQFAPYLSRTRGLDGSQNLMWRTNPFFSSGNVSKIDVIWGADADDTIEQHEIRRNCSDGKDYVWISYFKQPLAGHAYPITARKVLLTKSGVTTDLTNVCGTDGHVYALYLVDSTPYRIQVWGNTAPSIDDKADRAFYWSANYQYLAESANPFWGDAATRSRAVIRQEEAWWSKSLSGGDGVWDRGASGPIGADGEPTGLNVFNNTRFEIAKGAGFNWYWGSLGGSQTFGPYCVARNEPW